jgi:N-acetylglutamate synthase-like GNAT family acetyltransferase
MSSNSPSAPHAAPIQSFSEREFYLGEFRGRSIGIVWPADEPVASGPLLAVVEELIRNGSRVVLLSPLDEIFQLMGVDPPVNAGEGSLAPQVWRALREQGCAGLRLSAEDFEAECCRAALALRLAKVVWIQSAPPLDRGVGEGRVSVVDLAHLGPLLGGDEGEVRSLRVRAGREPMLEAIQRLIEGGIPSVNVCPASDLERELFTYSGAGMFFTRDRYAEVRPLSIEDYDLANDLIEHGELDGFLAPRDSAARDSVLVHGVGVFIEGRYLAGIGAILPHPGANAAELACLFALTRYVGEGAGGQIVRYAIDRAQHEGLAYVFSCTTSERVAHFFERHGMRRVSMDEVPTGKWEDYDVERRARVLCLRVDFSS